MNIILVGFSGSGKTTAGRELSNITGMNFIDTDVLIEQKLSLGIDKIFLYYGQRFFRYIESEVIKELLHIDNSIISAGGGAFINPSNIKNLKSAGKVVFLNASMETILENIKTGSRPLLKGEEMKAIQRFYESRLPFYMQADLEINADGKTASEVAGEVAQCLL